MTIEHSRLTRMEQRIIRMGQQLTRLEQDAGIEPCENPTPAEQADYDRALIAQEKGWNLLDNALDEGTWAVHSYVRRIDGSRMETTRTTLTREGAVHFFNEAEKALRLDLSGGPEAQNMRDWQRAESFALRVHGPGRSLVRESVGMYNSISNQWFINSAAGANPMPLRRGEFGTSAEPIF